jgi:hypothetical protein
MISAGCEVKGQHSEGIANLVCGPLDFAPEKCEHFNLLGHKFTQT